MIFQESRNFETSLKSEVRLPREKRKLSYESNEYSKSIIDFSSTYNDRIVDLVDWPYWRYVDENAGDRAPEQRIFPGYTMLHFAARTHCLMSADQYYIFH